MALNFNHLHYFHVAAEEGGISRAAERLGVTQPTVSEQIRMLERALGATLFERTPAGLTLTEAGRQAHQHTSSMFRSGERLLEAFVSASEPPTPIVMVGVSLSVSRTFAADFLTPFLQLERWVPTITMGETSELLRSIHRNELDLVLCEVEPTAAARRDLRAVPVYSSPLVAIVATSVTPDPSWSNVGLVSYRASSGYRWEVEGYLDKQGLRPRTVCETDDAVFMTHAVARGDCVAFVPRGVAYDAVAEKRVKIIATLEHSSAPVFAIFHDVDAAVAARRAVELLIHHAGRYAVAGD